MSMHSLVFDIDSSLATNDTYIYDKDSIHLFPNPVVSQLNLSFPTDEVRKISIYKMSGARVYHKSHEASSELTIDVKLFADGIYILKSSIGNEQYALKFLKIKQ
jgi:hypothetical protein